MSSHLVRLVGVAFSVGLFTIAACSADGGTTIGPGDDAGSSLPVPDGGSKGDGGSIDVMPDGGRPAGGKCGNFKQETGEDCDDGNTNDNDGCSGSCKLESAFEGDTCPGKTIALTTTSTLSTGTVSGSTSPAFNQYGSACGGGSGKDVVYSFTPTTSGKAIVKLTANYPAILSTRSTCEVSTTESKCTDIAEPTGGTTTMEIPVFKDTPAFLFVDGYGGSSGTFTIDIQISQAVCGNGIAELPEACDDGNTTSGDGCSATCTLEDGGVLGQCPGQPFLLSGVAGQPRKISFSGNTLTQGQKTQSPVGCFYWGGPNVVYAMKSDIDGAANVRLTAGYAKANVFARSDCALDEYQLGCTQMNAPGTTAIDFPVTAGQWFYVFVDGDGTPSTQFGGPYSVDITINPAVCGNGVIDGKEECDDRNTDDGDGCSATCTRSAMAGVAACPGHRVNLALQGDESRTATVSSTTAGLGRSVETCTSGMSTSTSRGDATFEIIPDVDGYLSATVSGPFNTALGITSSCRPPAVSPAQPDRTNVLACSYNPNATTDPYILDGLGSTPKTLGAAVKAGLPYYVTVSNQTSVSAPFVLDLKVTPSECGNGVIEGGEQCDDGATGTNDGCDASCQLEPITSRSTCTDAETIALVESTPGNYSASLERGTTNLLANHNVSQFTSDDDEVCWAAGKNAFFAVTAPTAGVLRATAKSSAFDVVLNFRKPTCALLTMPFMCGNDSGKGLEESIATPVAAGETVFVVVDSKLANEQGRFTLDVSVTPSGCGDGFFVPGPQEQCDDGNQISGDGCSATCTLEALGNVDVCPGKQLTFSGTGTQPRKSTITFATTSLNADYAGACGGDARDGVVKVVAPINGFLRAKMRGLFGGTVYARTVCNDPSTEIFKAMSTCPNVIHDTVSFAVTSGSEYYLFVDGLDGAVGVPSLDVTIDP
jgi:cysteine-rich repeat protein